MRPRRHCSSSLLVSTLIATFAVLLPVTQAMVAPPYPRLFASKSGRAGLKVIPEKQKSIAVAFTLAPDGSEQVLWRREFPNIPEEVEVFDLPRDRGAGGDEGQSDDVLVVTLDTWGRAGGDHALVVYGRGGKTLHDLKPADVLGSASAPKPRLAPADGGIPWRQGAVLQLVPSGQPGGGSLQLQFPDGRVASIGLPAGPVSPAAK